jgi:transposase
MSSQVVSILPIPKETARRAKATFSQNNFYIQIGEYLTSILDDIKPEYLLETGMLLPQITIFQFLEGLTDTQAIEAVRMRIDWKFALHLPSYSPVFHESELCKFRQRILTNISYQREFEILIERFLPFNHPQIDKLRNCKSTDMIMMICSANRLSQVHEAMSQAIEALVRRNPEWLRTIALPHWYGRYNHTVPSFDLTATLSQQESLIQEIITDIHYLIEEKQRSGYTAINELQELKLLDFIWTLQTERASKLLSLKSQSHNISNCDLCIYKERSYLGNKYRL